MSYRIFLKYLSILKSVILQISNNIVYASDPCTVTGDNKERQSVSESTHEYIHIYNIFTIINTLQYIRSLFFQRCKMRNTDGNYQMWLFLKDYIAYLYTTWAIIKSVNQGIHRYMIGWSFESAPDKYFISQISMWSLKTCKLKSGV